MVNKYEMKSGLYILLVDDFLLNSTALVLAWDQCLKVTFFGPNLVMDNVRSRLL